MKSTTRMFGRQAGFISARGPIVVRRCLLLISAAFVAIVAPASAAQTPPAITSAFTPASIAVGGTSTLSFTITNPNASGSLTGIAFSDTLSAGVVVDDPTGQNGSCGSASTLTATAGSTSITLAGGKLAAGATCTVSANVTSRVAAIVQNSTGAVGSNEGGAGNSDTQSLTVIAAPTVSLIAPRNGSTFNFGQKVTARYTCQEAANGPGLTGCSGDAPSGSLIDTTSTPGANTFTVTAVSADGAVTTDQVNYTVRPDNRFTIAHVKAHADGSVSFDVTVPGSGALQALESTPNVRGAAAGSRLVSPRGWFAFGTWTRRVAQSATIHVTVPPSARAVKLLKNRKASNPSRRSKVVIRLTVRYTPTGGLSRTVVVHGIAIVI